MTLAALYPILIIFTLLSFVVMVPAALLVTGYLRQRSNNRLNPSRYPFTIDAESLQANLRCIQLGLHQSPLWYTQAEAHSIPIHPAQVPVTELMPGPIMLPMRHHETLLYADDLGRTPLHTPRVSFDMVMAS